MKVLLVDDSKVLQIRLKRTIMSNPGVKVVDQAFNVLEAIELISEFRYDIIISDLRMPGGGGFELLSHVKKTNKQIKFIMLTNYALDEYKSKAIEAGADYFLSKTDEIEKLHPILEEIGNELINS